MGNSEINNFYLDAKNICEDLNGSLPVDPVLIVKTDGIYFASGLNNYTASFVYESDYMDIIELGLGIFLNEKTDKYEIEKLDDTAIAEYNKNVQHWVDSLM